MKIITDNFPNKSKTTGEAMPATFYLVIFYLASPNKSKTMGEVTFYSAIFYLTSYV